MPIFSLDSKLKGFWDFFMVLAIFAFALIIPVRIVFSSFQFDFFYWIITTLFFLDIFINFNTIYRSKRKIISKRKQITIHYLKSWFIIDLIAAIPWGFLFDSYFVNTYPLLLKSLLVLRLIRLIKLLKVNKEIRIYQTRFSLNPSVTRLITFSFWLILSIHFMSLGWILIGPISNTNGAINQYIQAFYWCITTISTIGFGDIAPDLSDNLQLLYTIIVEIFGVAMFGYIIGNVSSIIANIDRAKANYTKKMEEVRSFLSSRKIPFYLQRKVIDYYKYLWDTKKSLDTSRFIDDLPSSLHTDISLYLNQDIIERVPFFKNTSEYFIREIIEQLETLVYLPEDYILRQGEFGDCMYFLCSGEVKVFVNNTEITQLQSGSFFGEMSLVKGERRNASIRTTTYCDVYRLSKESFDILRKKYPDFDELVMKIYAKRHQENSEKI